ASVSNMTPLTGYFCASPAPIPLRKITRTSSETQGRVNIRPSEIATQSAGVVRRRGRAESSYLARGFLRPIHPHRQRRRVDLRHTFGADLVGERTDVPERALERGG